MTDPKAELEELYAAIMARVKGKHVSSLGHGGRSLAYGQETLGNMIKLYRMLWRPESGLPKLDELEGSTADRGCFRVRLN